MKLPRRYRRSIELTDPPAISIVTPSFNQGRFLERTILSVLDQDYPRLEYVVQDGGSTDETERVIDLHAERLHHHEMRSDEGQGHAINLGFEHTSGEIMAYLNSDDVLLPGTLSYVARYFQSHPDVDVVYGHRVLIDEDDMEIGRWAMPRHDDEVLSWADFVPQETMFWRRDIWERSGGAMDHQWSLVLDWDLIPRFRDAGANFVRLPRFLGAFRIHEVQDCRPHQRDRQGGDGSPARQINRPRGDAARDQRGLKRYLKSHDRARRLYRARLVRY